MRARVITLGLLFAIIPVACGVVDEGKVERIDPPFGLDDTLPSSTFIETTTTQQATTTIPLETTTIQLQTEPVRLYFVASGQLTYVLQDMAAPVAFPQIIAALQQAPVGDVGIGLRTIVPNDADIRVDTDGTGVAYITLPENFFEGLLPSDQRLVIAQLVLTITRTSGIGQVVFNVDVPLTTGQVFPAGQRLTFSDYESYTDPNTPVGPDPTPAPTTTGG
ncbi:MAG: GerMN domain-containing protein [Ilumatobacteraceae bacterium]